MSSQSFFIAKFCECLCHIIKPPLLKIFTIDCFFPLLLATQQFDDQELQQFDDEFSDFGEFDNTMQTEDFPDSLGYSLPPSAQPLDLEAIRAEHQQLPDFDDVDSGVYMYFVFVPVSCMLCII